MSEAGEIQSARRWKSSIWQRALLFGVAYFVCAIVGQFLTPRGVSFETFWLPAGLYLSALLLSEYRDWPWLAVAALAANLAFDFPLGTKLGLIGFYFAGGTVQAMVGAWLVRRFVSDRPTLATLKEFAGLLFFTCGLSTPLLAIIGAKTLPYIGPSHSFEHSFKNWWGSNAMAILLLAPILLAWSTKTRASSPLFGSGKKILEAGLLFLGLTFSLWYLLGWDHGAMSPNKSLAIPFLLWAGLRFGVRGAAITNFYLAFAFTFFTVRYQSGLTPAQFASGEYIFVLQTVLVTGALISLIPAIIISERDGTLTELRDSEERFRNLTRASAESICVSERGRILDANDQLIALFGYSREELVGREIRTLVTPEWHERVVERLRRGTEGLIELQILRKNGTPVDVEVRSKNSIWEGRTVRMTALTDITERKRSAAALLASENRFRTLIEQAPVAVSISRAGMTMYVNQKFLQVYGYQDTSEVVGHPIYDHWAPEFRTVIEERVRKRVRGEPAPMEYEGLAQRKDGLAFPVHINVAPVQLPDGPAWLAFIADITERKRAEQALRESEEKFSKAFRASPDGLSITETETGRFIEVNDGYCRLFGYRREEMLDHTAIELHVWENPQDRVRLVDELKKNGIVRNCEIRTRTQAGSLKLILISAEPIELAGKSCVVSVLHDITDRRRAEVEKEAAIAREQKARLEYTLQLIASQEAERTRIAAELHDSLGQNLLLIKNRAQLALMKERIDDDLTEQIEAISSLAAQSIAEARGISHDLHPYQLDHLGLTRALRAMVDKADESSGMVFKRKFDDVDDVFTKDAALNLYRTVQESLNNILKHSRAKNARIALERDVHDVQLIIEDDGCGFDPAAPGKGMGLKNIAERSRMFGGELKLESAPGRGTRIEIMIPIYAEAE
jgi:PAS domain S-box-containing protein